MGKAGDDEVQTPRQLRDRTAAWARQHLTIAYDLEPGDVAETVARFLPLEVELTELAVAVCDRRGRWVVRHRHPLGGGPP